MAKWCFGIDLGGTTVKCALFQTDGTVEEKWEIVTRTENNGEAILPDIAATILAKIEEKKIDKAEVAGVGIGVPGPVEETGEIPCAVNLHWGRKNIEKELGDLTGLAVKAGNDANVAALGEMWKGGGQGAKNLILVTLGTGVGGGIIVNEKIVTGAHGAGGEIGHAFVNPAETKACNCGNKGCLEQYASATGIVRLAKKRLAADDTATTLRDLPEVTAKDIFDAAKAGDAVSLELVETLGTILGGALAAIACVADPEMFVLGGGVSKAGQILLDVVQKHFKERAFQACEDTKFVLASLGNDAGMYGCAKMIFGK